MVTYNQESRALDIDQLRDERSKWLEWKNIKPLRVALANLPKIDASYHLGDTISIEGSLSSKQKESIDTVATMLKPWRKGPFDLFGTFIDTEWKSHIKYNLLRPYFNLKDKVVADVGCNNGYYMFRMLEDAPKSITGFDPSALYKTQFDFIDHFIQSGIHYEMLGIEHLPLFADHFDTIFCLGVLYHRSDPITALKQIKKALKRDGEAIIDTFMIDGDAPVALCPCDRYSKIPNVYFVPTIKALQNWCIKAGFESFEVLEILHTTTDEQRKTKWIDGESLESFLDPSDPTKTVEGYDAPKRVYVKIRRKCG
jgi:tRNA (mo5U34)-methyltransferase